MTNVWFAETTLLGHGHDDCLGNYGFYVPIDGNRFDFQRMHDKVKDGLVLSVV